jgi:hypothetical protein
VLGEGHLELSGHSSAAAYSPKYKPNLHRRHRRHVRRYCLAARKKRLVMDIHSPVPPEIAGGSPTALYADSNVPASAVDSLSHCLPW